MRIMSLLGLLAISGHLAAITIYNKTQSIVWCAAYYKRDYPSFRALRASQPVSIAVGAAADIAAPARRLGFDRRIVCARSQEDLKPELAGSDYRALHSEPCGLLSKTVITLLEGSLRIPRELPVSATDVYDVRLGQSVCDAEQRYTAQRLQQVVHPALKKITGMHELSERDVLRIGVCGSGGGYRALCAMLGTLIGLQDIGLFDCCLYVAGLSGSSWMLFPWLSSGLSLCEWAETISGRLERSIIRPSYEELVAINNALGRRRAAGDIIGPLDLYGCLIAERLLVGSYDGRLTHTLSDVQHRLEEQHAPFPLAVAFDTTGGFRKTFEFSPVEIGSPELTAFVATSRFGSVFSGGRITSERPEKPLAFFLGLWGSAFANVPWELPSQALVALRNASPRLTWIRSILGSEKIGGLWQELKQFSEPLGRFASNILPLRSYGLIGGYDFRLFAPSIPNSTYQFDHLPLANYEFVHPVDAAIEINREGRMNIGILSLLDPKRALDVIIVCDVSTGAERGTPLRALMSHAAEHHIALPPIDIDTVVRDRVGIFVDPAGVAPTIIYMPFMKYADYGPLDPVTYAYLGTANFVYTREQFTQAWGLARHIVLSHRERIVQILTTLIMQRQLKQTTSWYHPV